MKSKINETKQKRVLLKSYSKFQQIEQAIQTLKVSNNTNLQISIIGKFDDNGLDDAKTLIVLEEDMETKCKALFEYPIDFGILSNPDIGSLFITGFLVSLFLQEIELKEIGAMLTGPYGILRGLGIDKDNAQTYLKALHDGDYLIIIRGFENELKQFEADLN
ncbi:MULTISPECIES: hypothetical protein [unclassified Olleya]|uniref:hypothetical protein n=1 Tax=unclassified Olleya TaxID=2615019 RepID=UPI000C309892|nr:MULTISPECIES: hypothetical protein [unclassified Olleya]AUC75410.1 hypothetical protein CW732_06850 [Olleya sp. Bg11-27]QXP61323.1 hypothetical protein H0I26_06730 [Olleya sp. HaHaR_3_96]